MRMERKFVIRRRVTFGIGLFVLSMLFGYATNDVCYVGESGNWLGYGSCSAMIDKVIEGSK